MWFRLARLQEKCSILKRFATGIHSGDNDVEMYDGSFPRGEMTNRQMSAEDSYSEIYEQYVMGPRRGRKGGTYGRKQPPLTIKGPAHGVLLHC